MLLRNLKSLIYNSVAELRKTKNMQNQLIIHLCAGTQYSIGCRIANSGEDCGFSYDIDSSNLAIYTDKPVTLNLELATCLKKLFNRSYSDLSNSYSEIWRRCGDKSPEFSYDENLSNHICSIFNFFYNDYIFKPTDLNLREYNIYTDETGSRQIMYNFSSLFNINNSVEDILWNNMMKSLTYARNLKWLYKKNVCSNQFDTPKSPLQVISMAKNDSVIKISCGYVYPFDEFTPISEDIYECICHRPIFTIFSSCNFPISMKEAYIINSIIDKLSPLSLYKEKQKIGDNTYRFIFDAKLTDFIINIFSLLFNIQFKFIPWDFIPNNSIEYIHSSKIVRRYKDCVNLNATIYSIFEEFIHANDKCFHRFSKIYPVDNLYKYDVEADYNDFPF